MDDQPAATATDLCVAIEAALAMAEAAGDTLVAALLAEAHDAASRQTG